MSTVPDPIAVEVRPTGIPTTVLVAIGVVLLVVAASVVVGDSNEPQFFITYALIQAFVFLGLIYLADIYERESITAVALLVLWGGTVACFLALPGNQLVERLLSDDVRTVFGAAISAPLVEEASKGAALVIAFVLSGVAARRLGVQAFEGVTDGLVYGAAVGMGFALTEDVFYFYNAAGHGLKAGYEVFQYRVDIFGFNMLGHSMYTGLFGAGLGLATVMVRRHRQVLVAAAGFLLAVLAHASHNGLMAATLTARFGLHTTAGLIGSLDQCGLSSGPPDDFCRTALNAQSTVKLIDFLLVVGFFVAVALWTRYQQRVILAELAEEDPDVAPPRHIQLTAHYGERLSSYGRLLLDGRVEEWRLARVVHAELVNLAFLKRRVRDGRADVAELDNQRYLMTWAAAALRANHDKPDKGSAELLALSDEALRSSRYDLAQSLLDVRAELVIPDEVARGQLAIMAGRNLAESAFRPDDALPEYRRAVACFDRALAREPDRADAYAHRAGALFRLAEAEMAMERAEPAIESLRGAVASADAALALDTNLAEAHRNRSAAFLRLGEVTARSQPVEAKASFEESIASIVATLEHSPEDARAQNIAAMAWRGLGEIQSTEGLTSKAAVSYRNAIAAGAEALRLVPDFAYASVNMAMGWARLADLSVQEGFPAEAEELYRRAILVFDTALAGHPDYVKALAERGGARVGLGRAQVALGRVDEAAENARAGLVDSDRAHSLAPAHLPADAHRVEAAVLLAEIEGSRDRPLV